MEELNDGHVQFEENLNKMNMFRNSGVFFRIFLRVILHDHVESGIKELP